MIRFLVEVTVASVLLGGTAASAQEAARLSESARNSFRAATNAILALSSDDSLSAGTYRFKNDDAPDVDADLVKFNGEFSLGDPDDTIIPLFQISPAYVRLQQSDATSQFDAEVESFGLGAGGGAIFKLSDGLFEITPRFKIEYSDLNFDITLPPGDNNVVYPDLDAWSYIPSLQVAMRPCLSENGESYLITRSELSYIYIHATPGNAVADSFSDQSWIWKNSIAVEARITDSNLSSLYLRPQISRIDIHGAARNGFEFNNFYEFGLDLFSHEILQNYFQTLGFGATYLYEQEIQGWRLGFFADFA